MGCKMLNFQIDNLRADDITYSYKHDEYFVTFPFLGPSIGIVPHSIYDFEAYEFMKTYPS